MNFRKIFLIIVVLFTFSIAVFTQDDVQEMEERLKDVSLPKKERLHLYDVLSKLYQNLDVNTSISYANEGLILAEELKIDTTKAYLYISIGTAYQLNSKMDSAAYYYNKAKELGDKLADDNLHFVINHSLGGLYSDIGELDKSLFYYINNLRLAEKMGDESSVCSSLTNIGVIYQLMQNYEMAEDYLLQAKEIAERLEYKIALAVILLNLDEIYTLQNQPEKGLGYSKRAAELFHEVGYFPEEIRALLGVASNNLFYAKDYSGALVFANKAFDQAIEIGYPMEIGLCHRMFCIIYYEMDSARKAEEHALKALVLIDSTEFHSIELNKYLVKIRIDLRDAVNAKKNLDTYTDLMQLYNNHEMQKALSEMEVRYETEKKDTQINVLQRGKKLYTILTFIGLAAIFLLLLALFLFYRYQRQKRLRMKEKMLQLEQEKELVAARSLLEGENTERRRLSHELHDSLGGLLTMIKLDLEQLKNTVSQHGDHLNTALTLTNKSIQEMRRFVHTLMPESLARFGLRLVLEEFCQGSPQVNFCYYGDERRLGNEIEINIYRIACELINNALKHAEASTINVQLIIGDDILTLTVQDDGRGFSENETKQGFITVRSRAGLIGAELFIYSEEGKGSEISIELRIKS
jgi:Signal transduction histidine kinase